MAPERICLPIDDHLPAIMRGLADQPCAVITAEPGAGKSSRVPPAMAAWIKGAILVLQPRRVAARAVAERIAWEAGESVGGGFAGYRIRFENRTRRDTRIIVMTEGILARLVQDDPFLEGVSVVIIDEFHERSIHTDLALALVREIQQSVRPDLRLVIMSATMDPAPVAEYLGGCAVYDIPGRTFPLDIMHAPRLDNRPVDMRAAEAVEETVAAGAGKSSAPHVLVFLPGMAEIRRTADLLKTFRDGAVHILHSSTPAEAQTAALEPSARRKIILSTNIAETSLTIDGIGYVIDAGLARVPIHDARLGLDRLELKRISKASARQRAGRAGRSGPGRARRLYTVEDFAAMPDYDSAEILRLDLASTALMLKNYGVTKLEDFAWFEAPPAKAIQRANHLLTLLDAVDRDGVLTAWGRRLAALPLHPRLAAVISHGADHGLATEAGWLCALIEADDVTPRMAGASSRESDLLDRLAEVQRDPQSASWAVRNSARQVQRMAAEQTSGSNAKPGDSDAVLRQAVLRGFPDRVVQRRGAGDRRGVMVGRRGVQLANESRVLTSRLMVAIDVRERSSDMEALIHSASGIDEAWLRELLPDLCRTEEAVTFTGDKARGVRRELFADLVLSEKELGRLPEGIDGSAILLARAVEKFGSAEEALRQSDAAGTWLRRYEFIRRAMPEAGLDKLNAEEALTAACAGARSLEAALDQLVSCLAGLAPAMAQTMATHAPEHLALPSGNRARIQYPDPRDYAEDDPAAVPSPSVAARVQEMFGLAESPRLAGGRIPLVIELLSPARRPVQITRDLKSFWNTGYQEVRKELRARYPKHPWPEDPWTAPAVSIGSRRRS